MTAFSDFVCTGSVDILTQFVKLFSVISSSPQPFRKLFSLAFGFFCLFVYGLNPLFVLRFGRRG